MTARKLLTFVFPLALLRCHGVTQAFPSAPDFYPKLRSPRLNSMSTCGPQLSRSGVEPELTSRTLGHYSRRAEIFWEGTKDHDVSQNRDALIRNLAATTPEDTTILDLGCGPGRDVLAFSEMGYKVTGLDGCPEFVRMGQELVPGATFLQQDLHDLKLTEAYYDGIFANAALFHVQREALPGVLGNLAKSLKPNGVLFTSNPRSMQGQDVENYGRPGDDERYGHYQTFESWASTLEGAGLLMVEHYYRPPGAPREQQPWLATVSRKPGLPQSSN